MEKLQQEGIIAIIKSALSGKACELPKEFDLKGAAEYAVKSQIVNMLYYGAVNCGISQDSAEMQAMFLHVCSAIALNEQQFFEYNKITEAFNKNRIDYMPLKGILLKQIYPKPDMRSMSDIDILIKTEQYEKIKALFSDMGYSEKKESNHELPWQKNNIYVELHKRIISTYNKDFYQHFGDGWKLGIADKEQLCRYEMRTEDAFVYLFTHFAKHYRSGGIGIKHMTDLWVYLKAYPSMDDSYIEDQLSSLKLLEFYKNVLKTLEAWFSGAEPTEITGFITDVIFNSNSYGNHEDHIAALMIRKQKTTGHKTNTRASEIVKTFFLPYRYMREKYPMLNKAPVLLPFMWIVRGVTVIFTTPNKINKWYEDTKLMSDENTDTYHKSLKFVGLDYNYGDKE